MENRSLEHYGSHRRAHLARDDDITPGCPPVSGLPVTGQTVVPQSSYLKMQSSSIYIPILFFSRQLI